jgi:hypothetical protein
MQRPPEVSVILPTSDRPELLVRAVESILRQTLVDFELLIVDNNRIAPPVVKNGGLADALTDSRVRVIPAENARNAAMARNAGLAAACGAWITFLDDDDWYRADKLAAQHALATATRAPLVLCGYELVWPHRRRRRQLDRDRFVGDEIITHAALGAPMFFHVRDGDLRFDERLSAGEDMLYALQFIQSHAVTQLPSVAEPLVMVTQRADDHGVHSNKEAVWRAYQRTCFAARPGFSREARRAFLAKGRIERAMGGHGGTTELLRSLWAVLRSPLPRKWRLAAFAIDARLRR